MGGRGSLIFIQEVLASMVVESNFLTGFSSRIPWGLLGLISKGSIGLTLSPIFVQVEQRVQR